MTKEIWDAYDKDGNKLGFDIIRGEDIPEGAYHIIVEIYTITENNEVLITQRHKNKRRPLEWEVTSGAILKGETPRQGAIRELKEETGIEVTDSDLNIVYTCIFKNWPTICTCFVVFINKEKTKIELQEEETIDYRYLPYDDFKQFIKTDDFVNSINERFYANEKLFDSIILKDKNMRYKFCPHCGGKLSIKETNSLSQLKCVDCSNIFYQNPAVGVAAILIKDKKILLGRRNISYRNMWCIPCGYVEYYEDVREAAVREFKEETNLDIKLGSVFNIHSNFHNPSQHTVGIWFLVEEYSGDMKPDDDIDKLEFFSTKEIEDNNIELAFPTDKLIILELKEKRFID